jgi:hypothetical protein
MGKIFNCVEGSSLSKGMDRKYFFADMQVVSGIWADPSRDGGGSMRMQDAHDVPT